MKLPDRNNWPKPAAERGKMWSGTRAPNTWPSPLMASGAMGNPMRNPRDDQKHMGNPWEISDKWRFEWENPLKRL